MSGTPPRGLPADDGADGPSGETPAPDEFTPPPGSDPTIVVGEGRIRRNSRESERTERPDRVGDFRLGAKIGEGGMGAVWEAVHLSTGARAAVKLVAGVDSTRAAAVRAEVQGLAAVNVPNVVRVLDTGEDAGFVWVATERVDGSNLRTVLHTRRRTGSSEFVDFESGSTTATGAGALDPVTVPGADEIRQYVRWFRDLARALDGLHRVGLIHRDVKPSNIVVTPGGVPYLVDFGLAVFADDEDSYRGQLAGTRRYMSPEQALSGRVGLDERSDLFSLGVTFWEAITGEAYFRKEGRALLPEVAGTRFRPPSGVNRAVPPSLDRIFARVLAHERDARFASCSELADELQRWLDRGSRSHLESPLVLARRRPVALVLLVLVIGVVASYGVGVLDRRAQEQVASRARASELQELGALLRTDGAELDALDRAIELLETHADSGEFGSMLDLAVERGARARTLRILGEQGFVLGVRGLEQLGSAVGRWRAEADRLVGAGHGHEHLVFHLAFGRLMDQDSAAALALLESAAVAEIASRSRYSQHLRMMIHADRREFDEVDALREALPAGEIDPDVETLLGVFVDLWSHQRGRRGALAAEVPATLTAVIDRRADLRRFGRSLRARANAALGHYVEALDDVDEELLDGGSPREQCGMAAFASLACIRGAFADPDHSEELMKRGIRRALRAGRIHAEAIPQLALRVTHLVNAHRPHWSLAADWAEGVLRDAHARPETVNLVSYCVQLGAGAGANARAVRLAGLLDFPETAASPFSEEVTRIRSHAAWCRLRLAMEADEVTALKHVDEAKALLHLERKRVGGVTAGFAAVEPVADAIAARHAGPARVESAIESLEDFIDSCEGNPRMKHEIRFCHDCVKVLTATREKGE